MQKHPSSSASRKFQKIDGNLNVLVRAFDFANLREILTFKSAAN
jgi:hypothetical protein